MDRPSTRKDPLGNQASAQYDLNGNLTQFTDRKGQVTTLHYDGLNRPTSATFNDGSTITPTFDAGNRLTSVVDSLSGTISRTYDGLNRVLSEGTPQGSVAYTYDADGRRQTMTVSGQAQTNYAFDNNSRLTSITQGSSSVQFSYDNDGRRTSLTLPNGVVASYAYDAASQLVGTVYQGGVLAPADLEYSYDLAGRRIGMTGSLASTQLPAAVSSAIYNANNQLTQWGSTAMTYDLNGNTLNDGTNTYVWDARNRLVSADSNGAAFAYDSFGRRTGKNVLSANTNFLYDGVNPVQELNGSTVTANLLTGGIDERFTRTDANGTSNYITDDLGSTVALTDPSGNQQATYSYGPYGILSATGSSANSYTYTGRESDGLGIDYYRARYYNPSTGRFISEDAMGLAAGPNLYQYALGSPTNFRDPGGNFVEGCLIGMAGYEFGQAMKGLAGRKMDHGWNEAKQLAANCAIGFVTEGIGSWLEGLGGAGEAAASLAEDGVCCFAAGTPVHTKRGTVSVEKIKAGDLVLSRNQQNGKLEYKPVLKLTTPHQDRLVELGVEGEKQSLHPSVDHPFWVRRGTDKVGGWIQAAQMKEGDLVLTIQGEWRKVLSVVPIPGKRTVYNFEVEENHDYYVGTSGLLVHNSSCNFLALGKTDGLSAFARSIGGADTYESLSLDNSLSAVTDILASDADIAVQLEQVPGVIADEVGNIQSGVSSISPSAFEQELRWIANNPQAWNRITWYEGSRIVSNPFE